MRIAYLIMAYHQPELVARMIHRLDDGNCDFFIHVDRKVDQSLFERLIKIPHAVFVKRRRTVNWGGWNMVQATLDLLELARANQYKFDYFQLLSDSCYPIKSNQYIRDKLASNDHNYITVNGPVETDSPFHWWIANYHAPDFIKLRTFEKFVLFRTLRTWPARIVPRKPPLGMTVFKGWQWWCLNDECVTFMIDFIKANAAFKTFFRFVRIPDEMFFQTILINSPLRDSLRPGFAEGCIAGNHFVQWKDGRPLTLTLEHLPDMQATGACFARKFSLVESASLLDRLDAMQCDT